MRGDAPSAYLFKTIDARNLPPATNFNDPGTFGNFEAGATLRWNLWNGQRDQLGVWAAEEGVEAARGAEQAVANALVAGVVNAILDLRTATELRTADETRVETVRAQVAEAQRRLEAGALLKSDVLSLEVRLSEAQARRIRTEVARKLALSALKRLLALPADAPLELAPGEFDTGDLPDGFVAALPEAYRRRGEVQAARRAVVAAKIGVERARRGQLPRLDLQARMWGDDEELSFDRNWTVALALTWDAYDAGRRKAAVSAARAALEQVEEADRAALLQVAHEVETAYLRLEEAGAQHDVATRADAASAETLQLVETQFREGSATITRYLEAENARTQAQTAVIRTRLGLERARVNAARALGRFGEDES
jgi:outer membrane protein TolC